MARSRSTILPKVEPINLPTKVIYILFSVNFEGVSRGSVGGQFTGGQCFVVTPNPSHSFG